MKKLLISVFRPVQSDYRKCTVACKFAFASGVTLGASLASIWTFTDLGLGSHITSSSFFNLTRFSNELEIVSLMRRGCNKAISHWNSWERVGTEASVNLVLLRKPQSHSRLFSVFLNSHSSRKFWWWFHFFSVDLSLHFFGLCIHPTALLLISNGYM